MAYKGALHTFEKALISKFKALNIPLGGVSVFPRAEVADISEGRTENKEETLRQIDYTVEAMSTRSSDEANDIMDRIEEAIVGSEKMGIDGFRCVVTDKTIGTELIEVGEADVILHRRRSTFSSLIETI